MKTHRIRAAAALLIALLAASFFLAQCGDEKIKRRAGGSVRITIQNVN